MHKLPITDDKFPNFNITEEFRKVLYNFVAVKTTTICYYTFRNISFTLSRYKTKGGKQIYRVHNQWHDLGRDVQERLRLLEIRSEQFRDIHKINRDQSGYFLDWRLEDVMEFLTDSFEFEEMKVTNNLRVGDYVIGFSKDGFWSDIVVGFNLNQNKNAITEIRLSKGSFNPEDLSVDWGIKYVYRMDYDHAVISDYKNSSILFKLTKLKKFICEYSKDREITLPVVNEIKTCSYDNGKRVIATVDYTQLKGGESTTTLFTIEDLTYMFYKEFPFIFRYKKKRIPIVVGETKLKLVNNKLYPDLEKGKSYLIEKLSSGNKSSITKVEVTENNRKLLVPLNRFYVPFVKVKR